MNEFYYWVQSGFLFLLVLALLCKLVLFIIGKFTVSAIDEAPSNANTNNSESPEYLNRIDKIDMGDYVVQITAYRICFIIGTTTISPSFRTYKIKRSYYNDELIHIVLEVFTNVGHNVILEPYNPACYRDFWDMVAKLGHVDIPCKKEKIVCAAVWFKDIKKPIGRFNPVNMLGGMVICGLNHKSCIDTIKHFTETEGDIGTFEKGFVTSHNRFVSEEVAFLIAKTERQLNAKGRTKHINSSLCVEDLSLFDYLHNQ